MTARDSYNSTCKSADTTRVASENVNQNTYQETISASGVNVGYNNATGNNVNLLTATKNANATLQANRTAAAAAKMASLDAARETLRATGDLGPL
jgi:hypothetical protein